ncbi:MAG: hypothetical protein LPH19_11455, partial [Shewanella sp.]|nr:hypothetical protein [Shewanella sp.]
MREWITLWCQNLQNTSHCKAFGSKINEKSYNEMAENMPSQYSKSAMTIPKNSPRPSAGLKLLGKVRTSPRTALAYGQIRVQGIQLQQGGLPFKAQYH